MTSPSLLAQPSRSDGRSGRLLVRFVRLGRRLSQLPTGVLWAATLGWMAWIWWHSSKRGRVDVDPEFWWGWFTNLGHAPAFAFVALGLVAVESSRLRRRSGGARGVGEALVTLSVDLPADVADTGGLPRRAFTGQTFVEVSVELEVVGVDGPQDCTGTVVSDDLIVITSNGTLAPDGWVEGPSAVVAEAGDTVALTVGTMVRQGAQVQVTVGEPGRDTLTATFTAA